MELWQGYVFTHVCHSVHRGSAKAPWADTPFPPGQTLPWTDTQSRYPQRYGVADVHGMASQKVWAQFQNLSNKVSEPPTESLQDYLIPLATFPCSFPTFPPDNDFKWYSEEISN